MDVKRHLRRAFEEILDKMAFMFFDEPENEDDKVDENFKYLTKISFEGIITGYLHVFFSKNSAEQISRNLIGIREEDELYDDSINDAVREFTNMVMGRTLTTLNPAHKFQMGVPERVEDFTRPPEDMKVIEILGYLDDDSCKIVLNYKETPI